MVIVKKKLKRTLEWAMPIFVIIMLLPMPSLTASAAGTPDISWYDATDNTFDISNADQLAGLAQLVNAGTDNFSGKEIKLTADIDLSVYAGGEGWIPIGALSWSGDLAFRGTFDGNGKVVTNLTLNPGSSSAGGNIGLFGVIWGGTVKNLGLEGVNINSRGNAVGGVVGTLNNYGVIECCYITGSIESTGDMVGGVAGTLEYGGIIRDCWTTATVRGRNLIGGIVGAVAAINNPIVVGCAALSKSVAGAGAVGRIYGTGGIFLCSNNIAFDGMAGGDFGAIANSDSDKNGLSWTAADICADGTLGGRFVNDGNPWATAIGSLPGFGAAAPMPEHLRDFGPVPPTGVPDITAYSVAMLVFFVISGALWGYILRRRLVAGRNG